MERVGTEGSGLATRPEDPFENPFKNSRVHGLNCIKKDTAALRASVHCLLLLRLQRWLERKDGGKDVFFSSFISDDFHLE